MRALFKYSLLLLNIFLALCLLPARGIPYFNPNLYNWLGWYVLLIPILVLLQIGFIVFWLLSRKFLFLLVPVLSLVISYPVYAVCLATHPGPEPDKRHDQHCFGLMSFNVRLLDLYGWSHDADMRKKIIAYFKVKNPAILCLQEFYTLPDSKHLDNIKAIQLACGYRYVSMCNMHASKRGTWGNIIFSHFPITDKQDYAIDLQGHNLLQRADICINGDTLSVFNLHLKSNRFNRQEAALVNRDELPDWNDSTLQESKSIFGKLMDNSANRGIEADIVSAALEQSHHPVLLCGDLNEIPCSYPYFHIRHALQDVFLEKGFGLGKTYRNRFPFLRIDYIFHDTKTDLLSFEKPDVSYSDHLPLIARFRIQQP